MEANDRQRLREQFQDVPAERHPGQWDDLWKQDFTPWDRKGPSLALRDAVTESQNVLGSPLKDAASKKRRRALVPGCGRGYDVLLLASLGYDAYGLDASTTAIDAAQQVQQTVQDDARYTPLDPQTGRGEAKFLLQDFFKDDFLADTHGGDFDLVFDYTFLCALPPELRPSWSRRMSQLLAPTGHLICLEWPLGKDPATGGPPHGLTSDLYVRLFNQPGREIKYDASGKVAEGNDDRQADNALVRVAHSRPTRTHDAGKDTDYVSIWKHKAA